MTQVTHGAPSLYNAALGLKDETVKVMSEENKVNGKWKSLADKYFAKGIRAYHVKGDGETRDAELVALLKKCALESLSKTEQDLIAAETKTLDAFAKFQKDQAKKRIGSLVAKVANHLQKIEDDQGSDDVEAAPKTPNARLQADLDKIIAKIQKREKPDFKAPDVIKALKDVKAMIPAV
jgi:hypothetical protein